MAKNYDKQIEQDEDYDDIPFHYDYSEMMDIYAISPSGYIKDIEMISVAQERLKNYGFTLTRDKTLGARYERFAGTDEQRALSFSRAALSDSPIVMASRGGYGLSKILPLIDWELLKKHPKKYCGFSDFTAFNLAYLAKTGLVSYSGPNLITDFGREKIELLNAELFTETMRGELEILNFESEGSDPCDERGVLWGGNLCVMQQLLGTPYFPKVENGILFIEDVGEHPYRIERNLVSLWQAGVFEHQKAIILGHFTEYQTTDYDNGFDMESVISWLRETTKLPIIKGLPYGHGDVRVTLPVGKEVGVATQEGMAYLLLEEHHHEESYLGQCEHDNCTCGQQE
ncbi:LD-carboxypeptidase [Basilea psittacipulmonis]|uniref:LD-carboxypeptidase n=1 Tax=Basilea psittacipulmonis TaxID=1472345 RepID=UPI00068E6A19|nr:LD-carboxypeptidase [Basilea psittacipulmonis]